MAASAGIAPGLPKMRAPQRPKHLYSRKYGFYSRNYYGLESIPHVTTEETDEKGIGTEAAFLLLQVGLRCV